MYFALIIWAILIIVIAATACPGFFACLLFCGVFVGGPMLYIQHRKDEKHRKEGQKVVDECMKDGWR